MTLRGNGRGGPNQEYALGLVDAFWTALHPFMHSPPIRTAPMVGPVRRPIPQAHLWISETAVQSLRLGLDPAGFLGRNDATGFLNVPVVCS